MMNIDEKFNLLCDILRKTRGIAIAFSGGLDSTFLAAVAVRVLKKRAIAVTALSPTYPEREQKEASKIADMIGIQHEVVASNELDISGFAENPSDRCYYCKSELFKVVRNVARRYDIETIADGSNTDDLSDYRPGRKASKECGVISPLIDACLGKEEIRELSRRMNLITADKPAFACLASRFPYGSLITEEKLRAVDMIEEELMRMGLRQVRVRHHGDIARIEVPSADIERISKEPERIRIVDIAKKAGFLYVTLDMEGYRTGSMNEGLDK